RTARHEPASDASQRSCGRGERHVMYAGLARLVHHLDHQAGARVLVGLDHYRAVRLVDAQTLDVRAHAAYVNGLLVDPHLAVGSHRDEDVALVLRAGGIRLRALDLDTGFLDEGAGDDEENQHDENHIEHRRQIDASVFFLQVMATHTHPVILNRDAAGRPAGREPGARFARDAPG